jgi:hypothetical protein
MSEHFDSQSFDSDQSDGAPLGDAGGDFPSDPTHHLDVEHDAGHDVGAQDAEASSTGPEAHIGQRHEPGVDSAPASLLIGGHPVEGVVINQETGLIAPAPGYDEVEPPRAGLSDSEREAIHELLLDLEHVTDELRTRLMESVLGPDFT